MQAILMSEALLIPFYLSRADWYIYPADYERDLYTVLQYAASYNKQAKSRNFAKDRLYLLTRDELLSADAVQRFLGDSIYYYSTLQILNQLHHNKLYSQLYTIIPNRLQIGQAAALSLSRRKTYLQASLILSEQLLNEIFDSLNQMSITRLQQMDKKEIYFIYLQEMLDSLLAFAALKGIKVQQAIKSYCPTSRSYNIRFYLRRISDTFAEVRLSKSTSVQKYSASNSNMHQSVSRLQQIINKIKSFFKRTYKIKKTKKTKEAKKNTKEKLVLYEQEQTNIELIELNETKRNNTKEEIQLLIDKLVHLLDINAAAINASAANKLLQNSSSFIDKLLTDIYIFLYDQKQCLRTLVQKYNSLFSVVDVFEFTVGDITINAEGAINSLLTYLVLNTVLQMYFEVPNILYPQIYNQSAASLILSLPKVLLDRLFAEADDSIVTIELDWFILLLLMQFQRSMLIRHTEATRNSTELLELLNKAYRRFAYFVWLLEKNKNRLHERYIRRPVIEFLQTVRETKRFNPLQMF